MSNLLKTIWYGSQRPVRYTFAQHKNFSRSIPRQEKPSVSVTAGSAPNVDAANAVSGVTHIVKPIHKYALVWTGRFKTRAEIPEKLPHAVLDSALNKARVKIAIYMMIATAVLAVGAVYSGKQAAGRGENLAMIGLEHTKKLREQGKLEEASAGKTQ